MEQPPVEAKLPDWIFASVFEIEEDPSLDQRLNDEEIQFFKNELILCKEKAFELCQLTTNQSRSNLWLVERRKRLTATKCHKIVHAKSKKKRLDYLLQTKSLEGLPQLKYGIENEDIAREVYEKGTGNKVEKLGLVVKTSKPYLAASPDGVFLKDGELYLLEIKCPFTKKEATDLHDHECLSEEGYLKKNHQYYTQIQMQMFVCNAKKCHFFLYAPKANHLVEVQFDEKFC